MTTTNTTGQLLLLPLIFVYITGFFIDLDIPHWASYLWGSIIMYIMCSIVLNKWQLELKQLQGTNPTGNKPKGQWRK